MKRNGKRIILAGLFTTAVLLMVAMVPLRGVLQAAPSSPLETMPLPTPTLPSPTLEPTPVPTPDPRDTNREAELARLRQVSTTPRTAQPVVELPRKIRIPAINVEAPFEYVGLTPDGAMDAPKDGSKAGWYSLGPKPGERGNAVVAGHVDWGGKLAIFWGLGDLRPGDLIEVTAGDGKKYEFVVQWQKWFDADEKNLDHVFGQTQASELTLITCGGVFDKQKRQYLSRLVVKAIAR